MISPRPHSGVTSIDKNLVKSNPSFPIVNPIRLMSLLSSASARTHLHFKPLALAVSIGVVAGCASAPPVPVNVARGNFSAVQSYATEVIERAIAKEQVQGISIALVDDQRVVWSRGFGYADAEAKQPATADTLYRVGSISKLFTDTAAMQLAESGKLNLDEPVQKLLTGFAPRSWDGSSVDITARMLMTHHSGLQRDVAKSFQSRKPPRFTEIADYFDSYLAYDPGQILSYSNIGLTVLGSVVERVSGKPFEEQQRLAILDPLGMSHSAFDAAVSPSSDMAKSYTGREVLAALPLRDVPAGGLNSSVNDLSRFMEMIFANGQAGGHQVLKPESVAEMLRAQNSDVKLDFDTRVGLGWFLESPDKARIKGGGWVATHAGAIDGYRSNMIILPEHKLGVVMLSNSSTGEEPTRIIARQVLKVALQAKAGIRQPDVTTAQSDETDGKSNFVDKPIEPAVVARWVGNYTSLMGYVRIHSKDGKSLQIDALGHTAQLREREDGRFGLSYKLIGILPVNLGALGAIGLSRQTLDGREVLVAHEGPREALAGERIPATAMHPDLRRFVEQHLGKYEVTNAGDDKVEITSVQFLEDNGVFIAEVGVADEKQPLRVVLKPISGTQAIALGPLSDRGEMVEALANKNGHIEVQALGLTFRKVGLPPVGP